MARGEFDDLPGKGKPIDLTANFDTPQALRLAYSILRNADILPEEAELLKEIANLGGELDVCREESQQQNFRKAIDARVLKFNILMEQRKGRSSFR